MDVHGRKLQELYNMQFQEQESKSKAPPWHDLIQEVKVFPCPLPNSNAEKIIKNTKSHIRNQIRLQFAHTNSWNSCMKPIPFCRRYFEAINHADSAGYTALHHAVESGKGDWMDWLLDNGADVDCTTKAGDSAIHLAISRTRRGKEENFVDRLLNRAIAVRKQQGMYNAQVTPSGQAEMERDVSEIGFYYQFFHEFPDSELAKKFSWPPIKISVFNKTGLSPLHQAVRMDSIESLDALLTLGPLAVHSTHGRIPVKKDKTHFDPWIWDIDQRDGVGNTALHTATRFARQNLVQLLVENGASLWRENHEGKSSVFIAATEGPPSALAHLIACTQGRECVTDRGILIAAAERGRFETILLVMVHPFLIDDLVWDTTMQETRKNDKKTIFHFLAVSDIPIIEFLSLRNNWRRLMDMDALGRTPIDMAALHGKLDRLREMKEVLLLRSELEQIMDIGQDCFTQALWVAVAQGQLEITKFLISDRPFRVNELERTTGRNALMIAVCHGHVDVAVEVLLSGKNISMNQQDRHGDTLLHLDARNEKPVIPQFVQRLSTFDASSPNNLCDLDYRLRNENQETALHVAARAGNVPMVSWMIEHDNGVLEINDGDGNNAFHLAARFRHSSVVERLLSDLPTSSKLLTTGNNEELTPMQVAARFGSLNVIHAILLRNGDVVTDNSEIEGRTSLLVAAENGNEKIVGLLIRSDAFVLVRDTTTRYNCLDIAIEMEHKNVVETILTSEKWQDVLRNWSPVHINPTGKIFIESTNEWDTPMRRLIRKMPEYAKLVLDRCLTGATVNLEFLDDAFCVVQWVAESRESDYFEFNPKKQSGLIFPVETPSIVFNVNTMPKEFNSRVVFNRAGRIRRTALPYSNSVYLLRNHPLTIMVKYARMELLTHPASKALINRKWTMWKWRVFYPALLFYSAFVTFLTGFMMRVDLPNYGSVLEWKNASQLSHCQILCGSKYKLPNDRIFYVFIKFGRIYVMMMTMFLIIWEFSKLFKFRGGLPIPRLSYFKLINLVQLLIIVGVLIVMPDYCGCHDTDIGLRVGWQWQWGVVALFLSWIHFLLIISRIPAFGVQVMMFGIVARSFFKFALILLLLVIAFGLAFHLLIGDVPFSNFGESIAQTVVMIVDGVKIQPHGQFFILINVLNVGFVVLLSIIATNLLIGLAVYDVNAVRRNIQNLRLAMSVDLVLSVEFSLGSVLHRLSVANECELRPSEKNTIEFDDDGRVSQGVWWSSRRIRYALKRIGTNILQFLEMDQEHEILAACLGEGKVSMERRVEQIEKNVGRLDQKLDKILDLLNKARKT